MRKNFLNWIMACIPKSMANNLKGEILEAFPFRIRNKTRYHLSPLLFNFSTGSVGQQMRKINQKG